jgi:hypothetical protein
MNNDGDSLYRTSKAKMQEVIDAETAKIVRHIKLQQSVALEQTAQPHKQPAAKTASIPHALEKAHSKWLQADYEMRTAGTHGGKRHK